MRSCAALKAEGERRQLEALLSGEADGNDSYVEVHSGAGGTESCDWARMLLRMYVRWGERRKFEVEVLEETAGDEAGIKSATIVVKGHNAHGWLKTESGVHRLVRISPFDSNARRHTSFASVWVYPVVDDRIQIDINESDCRIDTYRASGAGGQHVNKTELAVRITHIPTGIIVACQMERSQHKNRATAWNMLRARLYERELEIKEAKLNADAASKTDIGWGHQIRSYVLQPYQMVKDLRTGYVSGTPVRSARRRPRRLHGSLARAEAFGADRAGRGRGLALTAGQGLCDLLSACRKGGPSARTGSLILPLAFRPTSRLRLATQDCPCKFSFATTMSIRP